MIVSPDQDNYPIISFQVWIEMSNRINLNIANSSSFDRPTFLSNFVSRLIERTSSSPSSFNRLGNRFQLDVSLSPYLISRYFNSWKYTFHSSLIIIQFIVKVLNCSISNPLTQLAPLLDGHFWSKRPDFDYIWLLWGIFCSVSLFRRSCYLTL